MQEIWKDIKGYEGYYQVSNLGRVKSVERITKRFNGHKICEYIEKEKMLRQYKEGWDYIAVKLFKNSIGKNCKVHRLVAQAFIENPDNLPQVNHKDENKENNCVDNLEWCDNKYNSNYGTRGKKISEKLKGRKRDTKK